MRVKRGGGGCKHHFNVGGHLRVMRVDEGGQDHLMLVRVVGGW